MTPNAMHIPNSIGEMRLKWNISARGCVKRMSSNTETAPPETIHCARFGTPIFSMRGRDQERLEMISPIFDSISRAKASALAFPSTTP